MKKIIPGFLIVFLASCGNLLISKTEKEAVNEVLKFYGGTCNYSFGFATKNGSSEKYFELEIRKSQLVETYSKAPEIPASNIAYLFYKNLKNEQSKYDNIRVKIDLEDGQSHEYKYDALELNEVINTIPILNETSAKIKNQDFIGIFNSFDDSARVGLDENKLKAFLSPYDSAYGTIKQTQFQGFSFLKDEFNNQKIIQLYGVMQRTRENTPITVLVSRLSDKIFLIRYGL